MPESKRIVCSSAALADGGQGIRFQLPEIDDRATGFVVRYQGKVYAYVNKCAHVPIELDWNEGDFFDITKYYLICSTHGAHYNPETGYCVMGPCKGRKLKQIAVSEVNDEVWVDTTSIFS
ncbi:MAG TPA: Rieske 2Fe-2S domain-containing protein [Methylophilaceae bacterium]|jgi:nitrite reductase/ring-hydroxylating ferredoxin subunit